MQDLIPVRVRECPDGSHPDGDHVYILPKLSLEGGIAARQDVDAVSSTTEDLNTFLVRRWMVTFCRYGAVSWELHDPGGEVWPFDVSVLLADHDLAYVVADKADDLYRESVMRPLLERARSNTSRSGAAGGSTSPKTTSTGSRRRSSSRPASAGQPSPVPSA